MRHWAVRVGLTGRNLSWLQYAHRALVQREMAVTVTNAKVLQWRALRRAARIDETGAETARALPGGRRGQPRRSREEAG